ncbi:mitochondrial thiamine pyrophosphate carrier-like [Tigriopus californicus]|nr:mitochondrial thiamine pyrophosphate carrier-like [Tigriopus californicus]
MSHIGYRPTDDPDHPVPLSHWEHSAAGGISSCGTRLVCQPLDVLKIRLQLQIEDHAQAKYRSLPHALTSICREEGPIALWKGHGPAQFLSLTYGVCQFSAFHMGTQWLYSAQAWTVEPAYRPLAHALVGGMAGLVGTVLSYPFDVIRTRLVAQGADRHYQHTLDAGRQMYRSEGIRAFSRGLVPTFATVAPYSGLQFGFYSFFIQLERSLGWGQKMDSDMPTVTMGSSLSAGALAGLGAKLAVYPFDTTKKRLQVQGFEVGRRALGRTDVYSGMTDCISKTLRHEGLRGLYRGLTPGLLKAVVTTSINFWLYEYTCLLITYCHRN